MYVPVDPWLALYAITLVTAAGAGGFAGYHTGFSKGLEGALALLRVDAARSGYCRACSSAVAKVNLDA